MKETDEKAKKERQQHEDIVKSFEQAIDAHCKDRDAFKQTITAQKREIDDLTQRLGI